jgi:hypothetical protein
MSLCRKMFVSRHNMGELEVTMKKIAVLSLLFVMLSVVTACAMGPIYTGSKTAAWDAVSGATGYYIYWRTPGTTTWPTAQRATTSATTLDLAGAGIPQGAWEVCATAFDSVSESGPSNVVTWNFSIRASPPNVTIK